MKSDPPERFYRDIWPEFIMPTSNLISAEDVAAQLGNPKWVLVDCRFSLADSGAGFNDYYKSHIPGAVYAHLDNDLSGNIHPGATGRHPLPNPEEISRTLGKWGIDNDTNVVIYDDAGGAFAARLWWMLRWLGHENAAVLDGGWGHWSKLNMPTASGVESHQKCRFAGRPNWKMVAEISDVINSQSLAVGLLIDSRSEDRFAGQNETIDPVAGHIPGAVCLPYQQNLDHEGLFLPANQLKKRFNALFGDLPADEAIFYCGSGVSAAHNLLAMSTAGYPMARLYVGSWSEWIVDPQRPIGTIQ